jgi:16S rRNA (cytosine1402-N4)-methyltransferase
MGQMPEHIPVLPEAVLTYLDPQKGEAYLDATAGYGGHARRVLEYTHQDDGSVLVDRDKQSIDELKKQFSEREVQIIQNDFVSAAQELLGQGKSFDLILADLGVSSPHLDIASRGFSFNESGPLDMRMDQSQPLTAERIVNTAKKEELMRLLREYGEEYKADRIAEAIIQNRPIKTTDQLAQIVTHTIGKSFKGAWSKSHPATKTFQALRIAVNDELGQLKQALELWTQLLRPGGRLGIITFHSLEDRIVKHYFAEIASNTYDANFRLVTKKPVVADKDEIVLNPRARSAKLRVVAKIKTRKEH